MNFIHITSANFEEHKKRIIKIIENLQIEDLDSDFEMNFKTGIEMGNHAYECDSCNIFHHLMAFVIDKHRLDVGK